MALGKRYCPSWVYDCVVAQSVIDFISYKVDLIQPCKKYSEGLSELYEEVSLEEMVRASELVVSFLAENQVNEDSVDLLSSFGFYRFYYVSKDKKRKFGGLFGSSNKDDSRNYSGNLTLKSLHAYYFERRSSVHILGSPGWTLATQTEIPEFKKIATQSL